MIEFGYVVTGICRHFDGEVVTSVVGVRRDEAEAKRLGSSWVSDKTAEIKTLHQHWHVSYKLNLVEIR